MCRKSSLDLSIRESRKSAREEEDGEEEKLSSAERFTFKENTIKLEFITSIYTTFPMWKFKELGILISDYWYIFFSGIHDSFSSLTLIFHQLLRNCFYGCIQKNALIFLSHKGIEKEDSDSAGIYLIKINNRNTRTKVWNMFKVNNKDTKTTSVTQKLLLWVHTEKCFDFLIPQRYRERRLGLGRHSPTQN